MQFVELKIPALLGRSNQVCLIDKEDLGKVTRYRWRAEERPNGFYAIASVRIDGKPKKIYMHRLLLPSAKIVDHENRDGLDNRKSNLRNSTRSQNVSNQIGHKTRISKYKGVYFSRYGKRIRRWFSQIQVNKINHRLGSFHTEVEAAQAYNEAAKRLHGDFAYLNKIEV